MASAYPEIPPRCLTRPTGMVSKGYTTPELPSAISDFHLILWNFIIIHFTLVDLDNRPFKPDEVWTGAIRRYLSKVHSLQQKIRLEVTEAQALERSVNIRRFNALLAPLATIDETGKLRWSSQLAPHAASLCPGSGDSRQVPSNGWPAQE